MPTETTLTFEQFSNVEAKPILWLWPDRIPRQKLTIFSGPPDCGKTTVLIDVIARYSTGRDYADGSPNTTEPGKVLMLIAEDDPADTIKPRLIAAEADVERVSYLKAVEIKQNAKKVERALALDQDLALLEAAIVQEPSIGLITIDPISSYLGKVDLNKEQELRRVLVPLKDLAERTGATIIGLGHFNKRADVSALGRVGGAVAMTGVPRAVWAFGKSPTEDDIFLMQRAKLNVGARKNGLRYRLGVKELATGSTPFVDWAGDETRSADEILELERNPEGKRQDKAARFLASFLASGSRSSTDVLEAGSQQGISGTLCSKPRRNSVFQPNVSAAGGTGQKTPIPGTGSSDFQGKNPG
jgi:putative DNA primase/helicase